MLASKFTSDSKGCFCCNGSDSDQELKQAVKEALATTTQRIANTSKWHQLLDCDWIHLVDSGDQIEFLEALPAFIQHTSACLFVTNLSEKLSEHPKLEYFENGKLVGEPTLCPFTDAHALCADNPDSVHASRWQYRPKPIERIFWAPKKLDMYVTYCLKRKGHFFSSIVAQHPYTLSHARLASWFCYSGLIVLHGSRLIVLV